MENVGQYIMTRASKIVSSVSRKQTSECDMSSFKELPTTGGSVDIVLLDGGGFTTTDDWRIHADGHDKPYYLYDWCFYIHHKPTGQRILWDLGISNVSDDNVHSRDVTKHFG